VAVSPPGSEIERDADRAAGAAVASLWSNNPGAKEKAAARPRHGGGLQLQRCSPAATQQRTGPLNEEDPAHPMTPSQDPTVETVRAPLKNPCDKVCWLVKFRLPLQAADRGYFVQHVSVTREAKYAGGTNAEPPGQFDFDFYEAFLPKVPQGAQESLMTSQTKCGEETINDEFTSPEPPSSTWGSFHAKGLVKFYVGNLTNDFVVTNAPPTYILPRTLKRPAWWNDTGTAHNLDVQWNCSGKQQTTGAQGTTQITMQRGGNTDQVSIP
jgi:hypothetical protein